MHPAQPGSTNHAAVAAVMLAAQQQLAAEKERKDKDRPYSNRDDHGKRDSRRAGNRTEQHYMNKNVGQEENKVDSG